MTEPRLTSITFDGRNATAVLGWLEHQAGMPSTERWFLTKGMTAATGGQAWRYARDDQPWPDSIKAAVYSPVMGAWYAVAPGDEFRSEDAKAWVQGGLPDACPTRKPYLRTLPLVGGASKATLWYSPGHVG